ncbi:MAG: tRNA pseudouridine(55) synthase TruB [Thermoanaerobaculia bacterium]
MNDGVLLADKAPSGTSHDVVQRVRRILGEKRIGHCGTLDPGATGLLVLTAGQATRLTRFLISAPKIYAGEIRFGAATDTYDAHGTVVAEAPIDRLDPRALAAAMQCFLGTLPQMAPPFSAKKIQGRKYYELARRGEEVPPVAKEVTIYEFAATGALADGLLPFLLSCSSGTYVRSVAHDLGQALGCGAHLASLRRLQVGPFRVEDAIGLPDLERAVAAGVRGGWWVPFDAIPLPFGELTADATQELRIAHGQAVLIRGLEAGEGDWVKVLNRRRELIAVGAVTERIGAGAVGIVQPKIVFAGRPA